MAVTGAGIHNLAALAEESFERHGDYESLFFEGVWLRSGDLIERSRRVGAGLVQLGISGGDRVVVVARLHALALAVHLGGLSHIELPMFCAGATEHEQDDA